MNSFLSSKRSKWIFAIGVVAIGAGFTAKNVISYPTECTTQEMASSWKPLRISHSNFPEETTEIENNAFDGSPLESVAATGEELPQAEIPE